MDITIENLTKRFDDQIAVKNLSLEIPEGKIYGFIGANGAGKTTTMKMMVGLLKPDMGVIRYGGKELKHLDSSIMQEVGVFISKPNYYPNLTARENLTYLQRILGKPVEDADRVLKLVRLDGVENKKVSDFSFGMKQRLGLDVAFLNNPKVLILDEPTNGLDPKGIFEIREMLGELAHQSGCTVFISSHNISEIEKLSDRICIIDRGQKIFEGTVEYLYETEGLEYRIRTNDSEKTAKIFDVFGINYQRKNEAFFMETAKENIPKLLKNLIDENVEVYEVSPDNSLESIYLTLTAKKRGKV